MSIAVTGGFEVSARGRGVVLAAEPMQARAASACPVRATEDALGEEERELLLLLAGAAARPALRAA